MKIRQFAHLALAAVLLLQSVSAFANLAAASSLASASMDTSLEAGHMKAEGKMPCHHKALASVSGAVKDCCASMDAKFCKSGCAATGPGVALPVSLFLVPRIYHAPLVDSQDAGHVEHPLSGLFRPPRSIQ